MEDLQVKCNVCAGDVMTLQATGPNEVLIKTEELDMEFGAEHTSLYINSGDAIRIISFLKRHFKI